MEKLSRFNIPFLGLTLEEHHFEYLIDASFFNLMEGSLIEDGKLKANVTLTKQSNMMTLDFDIKGDVYTTCDRCLEPITVPLKSTNRLLVKFGEVYDEPTDEIIVLPHDEHTMNIAQFLYEFIGLSLPVQCIHGEIEGNKQTCDPQMVEKLKTLSAAGSSNESDSDPRWDALRKLIDNK